jgi:hypothetical protein
MKTVASAAETFGTPVGAGMRGTEKPRGLENAALQHLKKEQVAPPEDSGLRPAAIVELGRVTAVAATYGPPEVRPAAVLAFAAVKNEAPPGSGGSGATAIALGEGASLAINVQSSNDHGPSATAIALGDGASLKINVQSQNDDGPSATAIALGKGASLEIDGDISNHHGPSATAIALGDGASLKISVQSENDSGPSATAIAVGNGASLAIAYAQAGAGAATATAIVAEKVTEQPAETAAAQPPPAITPPVVEKSEAPVLELKPHGPPHSDQQRRHMLIDMRWLMYRDLVVAPHGDKLHGRKAEVAPDGVPTED